MDLALKCHKRGLGNTLEQRRLLWRRLRENFAQSSSLNPDQAWINLNRLVIEIGDRRGYSVLDRLSQQVLEWVAETSRSDQPIYVQTVIMNSGVASPATLHKAMSTLEDEGFLQFKKDPSDTRRRIVLLTKKSETIFRAMSLDLLKALNKFPRP